MANKDNRQKTPNSFRTNLALISFIFIAGFFLCPLLHIFMHGGGKGGHGHHDHDDKK